MRILKVPRPIIYLSGWSPLTYRAAEKRKMFYPYKCFSFCYTCRGAFRYASSVHNMLKQSIESGDHIMMDSSAYSFHQYAKSIENRHLVHKLKGETVARYIEYCKRKGDEWDFYVNFDYVKDCPTIWKMQEKLQRKGLRPVPVYHGDQTLDWFRRYCEAGHKLICVGISSRGGYESKMKYYDQVFNEAEKHGVLLHALGMTSMALMFRFPWYSVDSATWIKAAAYGMILIPDVRSHSLLSINISGRTGNDGRTPSAAPAYHLMPKASRKEIGDYIEGCGFTVRELKKEHTSRALFNMWMVSNRLEEMKESVREAKTKWHSLLA